MLENLRLKAGFKFPSAPCCIIICHRHEIPNINSYIGGIELPLEIRTLAVLGYDSVVSASSYPWEPANDVEMLHVACDGDVFHEENRAPPPSNALRAI